MIELLSSSKLIISFFVSFIFGFVITPFFSFIALKLQIVDLPASLRSSTDPTKERRIHNRIIPRSAGFIIFLGLVLGVGLFVPLDRKITGLLIGAFIIFLIGVLDDKYDIKGIYQLFAQFIAALVIVLTGTSIMEVNTAGIGASLSWFRIEFFSIQNIGYGFIFPADLITIAWILIIINAFNWLDGLDGLSTGIAAISTITILIFSIRLGNSYVALLSVITLGSMLGYLPYNLPPAKTFAASAGASLYGFIIAVLAIFGSTKATASVLVLLVPLIDMVWVLIGRIIRERITNPIKLLSISDKTHLHHRLLDLGLSSFQVMIIEYLFVGFFAILSIAISGSSKSTVLAVISFAILLIFLVISINLRKKKVAKSIKKDDPPSQIPPQTPEERYKY